MNNFFNDKVKKVVIENLAKNRSLDSERNIVIELYDESARGLQEIYARLRRLEHFGKLGKRRTERECSVSAVNKKLDWVQDDSIDLKALRPACTPIHLDLRLRSTRRSDAFALEPLDILSKIECSQVRLDSN